MRSALRQRPTHGTIIAYLALFIAVGGGAVAIGDKQDRAVVNADGEIQACYDKKGRNKGEVRLLVSGKCKRTERKILWSQQGPPGQQGEAGPQGQQGQQGAQGEPGPATGPASGDLTGNYPDPQVASGAVTRQELGCAGNGSGDAMVHAGSAVCIDTYENSIWSQPNGGELLNTSAAIDAACPDNGQPTGGAPCTNFYARSIPGVKPARNVTWFQAQQALANSGKRLPTNAEWQQAVSGTPDTAGADDGIDDCNTDSTFVVADTGSRAACVSRFGSFDMVGNASEWVADWDEEADACGNWPAGYGSDLTCFGDATPSRFPGALIRGGDYGVAAAVAGPFAVSASHPPSDSTVFIGFRGAR